ncbi:hypothetical protein BN77_2447 [Rhizobium mesoamericanum STM3625]|uniref:Uncharacterized protein n=1 Tax=Rhizobium mesoamericanum STM3625 TaxID=1211777 RepID=K0PMW6_9HYPH|nr:hypothetical protein BN77_2447 [Rhizobium mesoamericanum STM3625]
MVKFGYLVASLLILIGVVWMGQGSGYFPYPKESFMINQTLGLLGRSRSDRRNCCDGCNEKRTAPVAIGTAMQSA